MCESPTHTGLKFKTKNNNVISADDGKCMMTDAYHVTLKPCDELDVLLSPPVEWKGDDELLLKGKSLLGISTGKLGWEFNSMKFQRLNPGRGERNK